MNDPRTPRHDELDALVEGFTPIPATAEGALSGVEAVVKDCFAVAGHTNSNGSERWLATHGPASVNSRVVAAMLDAGASIVGMARMDQLAFSLIGDTCAGGPPLNPRHPEMFCGGSSAGAGSAVAGARATLGVGTDTAGSVRVPAAMCGVHGLRPTWGSIDMTGCIPLAPSFDTAGIIAANPLVMRLALRTLSTDIQPASEISRVLVDPSLATDPALCLARAREIAAELGADLEHVDLGQLVNPDVGALHSRLQGREVWASRGAWAEPNIDGLDDDIADRLRACADFAAEDPETIGVDLEDRHRFGELLGELIGEGCVLVKPVLGSPLPAIGSTRQQLASFRRNTIPLMAPAGLTGWPELTWTPGADHADPSAAVGLLSRPGNDELLVGILERMWAAEGARDPGYSSR